MGLKPAGIIEKLNSGKRSLLIGLGDSLTYGWMVPMGFLDFLGTMLRERYPGADLIIENRGIPGDTADGGLRRLRSDVSDFDPDCVLVQFGLNDSAMGIPVEQYGNYIQAIVQSIRDDTSSEIVLVTSVVPGYEDERNRAYRYYEKLGEIAEKNDLPLSQVHRYWESRIRDGVSFDSLVQYDRVHPTVEGYRLMAEAVAALFY